MKEYINYYYNGTTEKQHTETDKFIKEHKDEKKFYLSLYYSVDRLAKYQRAKDLFWDGCFNEFDLCKTSDLKKYNGLYNFEDALNLFKEFHLENGELIRLNYLYNDNKYHPEQFVFVRDLNKKWYIK